MSHGQNPSAWQWWLICLGSLLAFSLGGIGFREYQLEHSGSASWSGSFYQSLQLFILHTPHLEGRVNGWLETARWLAPLVFGAATLKTFLRLFGRHLHLARLGLWRDHVVVCGVGQRGLELVRGYRARGERVVVIEQNEQLPALSLCEEMRVPIVLGDARDKAVLARARVFCARRLIAVCGDDGVNVDAAMQARHLAENRRAEGECLECFVELTNTDLRETLEKNRILAGRAKCQCHIRFFDFYASQARLLLQAQPLDRNGISVDDARTPHLVIMGFGKMGRAIALKAAQLGHFANGRKLRLTIVDRAAKLKRQKFLFRYPRFEEICETTFLQQEVESPEVLQQVESWCAETRAVTSLAVCFDNDSLGLEVGLRLRPIIGRAAVPLALRLSTPGGLATLLQTDAGEGDIARYCRPFGVFKEAQSDLLFADTALDTLARALHEEHVAKAAAKGRRPAEEQSLQPWDLLDEEFKESNRQCADHLPLKLRAIDCVAVAALDATPASDGFSEEETELLAECEHRRWCAERLLGGWTHAPGQADRLRKTHPDLVEWNSLPNDEKDYDRNLASEKSPACAGPPGYENMSQAR